eukprot:TRINITY_DN10919_c0_g1_i1.p1 TRINITY_DN10919_c0_g1~~TRINITY_DN10919_c0_g1_i1.p1  ORF type:complete len:325 (-),score=13.93 TRINITY_DN10919_c0_g1_i1:177-1151(-)
MAGFTIQDQVPVGQVVSANELEPGQKPSLLSRIVAAVTLGLYVGWIYILIILGLLMLFSRTMIIVNILLWSTLLIPAPMWYAPFLNHWIFETWRQYFSYSFKIEEQYVEKEYILAEFPHGVFPMGQILGATIVPKMFSSKVYALAASVLFNIPLYTQVFSMFGCRPATKYHFKALLKKASVAVIVGGIAEIYLQHPKKERIKLLGRKGFIRVAVETGTDIIPVYHFGNTQLLDFGPQWIMNLARKLQASLGFVYGVYGLPIPRRHKICMVCGKPVSVGPAISSSDPKFDETVNQVHAKFIQELKDLYDRNKAEFGWSERPLEIL